MAHAPLLGTLVSEPREGALMEDRDSEPQLAPKRSLVSGGCGYGIFRAAPPDTHWYYDGIARIASARLNGAAIADELTRAADELGRFVSRLPH